MDEKQFLCECEECNFSARMKHSLDEERFPMQYCPVCGSTDFHCDEEEHE